jgi:hypothetical protein
MIALVCPKCGRKHHATTYRELCPRCRAGKKKRYAKPKPLPLLPGDALSRMLHEKGYVESAGCNCQSRMTNMNRWGVSGCLANIDTIVDWLEESAKERTVIGKALYVPGLRALGREKIRQLVFEAIISCR